MSKHGPQTVGRLAPGSERPPRRRRGVFGDGRPRLHEDGGDPVIDDVDARHVRGLRERRLDGPPVAALPLERFVALVIVPDQGCLRGKRLVEFDRRQARLVVDPDQLRRILGFGERLGHDEHDGLAGIARPLPGQGELLSLGRHRPVGPANVEGRRARVRGNRPDDLTGDVGGRQDQPYAGRVAGGRDVNRPDARVGVRRSHDGRVELAGQGNVIREAGGTGQEP